MEFAARYIFVGVDGSPYQLLNANNEKLSYFDLDDDAPRFYNSDGAATWIDSARQNARRRSAICEDASVAAAVDPVSGELHIFKQLNYDVFNLNNNQSVYVHTQ
jgi:hypothetical protein